jgi:hypothetical protein
MLAALGLRKCTGSKWGLSPAVLDARVTRWVYGVFVSVEFMTQALLSTKR